MCARKMAINTAQGLLIVLVAVTIAARASAADHSRKQVIKIVTQIQRADYEDDRPALQRLQADLARYVKNKELAARVQYWRGFALWRRAINGFNDKVAAAELQEDLKAALDEFNDAASKDPAFADAKIGSLSCVSLLAFSVHQEQPTSTQIQDFITQARQLRKDAEALEPENPRLPWVMGPIIWNTPPERGGSQAKAIELYEKGLQEIRSHKPAIDPLQPSWGEPELLMSLAWSNLNRTTPDLAAAEQYASSALKLVPHWHYVRDILMPQIQEARKKTEVTSPNAAGI